MATKELIETINLQVVARTESKDRKESSNTLKTCMLEITGL